MSRKRGEKSRILNLLSSPHQEDRGKRGEPFPKTPKEATEMSKHLFKRSGLVVVGGVATATAKSIDGLQFVGRKTKQGAKAVAHSPKKAAEKVGVKLAEHRALSAFEEAARLEKIQAGQAVLIKKAAEEVN
jgi:hypothetical protein